MRHRLFLLAVLTAFVPLIGLAADEHGHDHDAAAPVNANGPQRRPDGSVFLPKPAQRQIVVRTFVAEEQELPRSLELTGKVVMDPNAGGKVQALQSGRVQAGPRGLPGAGQTVRQGEALAYVVPSASQIERSNQAAQLADLRASRALAEKRLERQKQLADTIPRKEIDATESELASLTGRIAAVGAGLSNRETLVAPLSGVIASSNVVAGQVVDARELIFEIVDPTRLRIEALAFDAAVANNIAAAYLALGEQKVPLGFIGAGRSLREQALPLMFRAEASALTQLSVGQPVKVVAQTRTKVKGVPVPAASVLNDSSNQAVVWVKTAPEAFSPRVVVTEPLDGTSVIVTSGLKTGDKVVTRGASLINQIR
jgi:cobalt-zinc-cadmium efflux system membrane fusion protein